MSKFLIGVLLLAVAALLACAGETPAPTATPLSHSDTGAHGDAISYRDTGSNSDVAAYSDGDSHSHSDAGAHGDAVAY